MFFNLRTYTSIANQPAPSTIALYELQEKKRLTDIIFVL